MSVVFVTVILPLLGGHEGRLPSFPKWAVSCAPWFTGMAFVVPELLSPGLSLPHVISICLTRGPRDFKACPVRWVARDGNSLQRRLLIHPQLWPKSSDALSAPLPYQLQLLEVFTFLSCYLATACPLLCKLPRQLSSPHTAQLSRDPEIHPGARYHQGSCHCEHN